MTAIAAEAEGTAQTGQRTASPRAIKHIGLPYGDLDMSRARVSCTVDQTG